MDFDDLFDADGVTFFFFLVLMMMVEAPKSVILFIILLVVFLLYLVFKEISFLLNIKKISPFRSVFIFFVFFMVYFNFQKLNCSFSFSCVINKFDDKSTPTVILPKEDNINKVILKNNPLITISPSENNNEVNNNNNKQIPNLTPPLPQLLYPTQNNNVVPTNIEPAPKNPKNNSVELFK